MFIHFQIYMIDLLEVGEKRHGVDSSPLPAYPGGGGKVTQYCTFNYEKSLAPAGPSTYEFKNSYI